MLTMLALGYCFPSLLPSKSRASAAKLAVAAPLPPWGELEYTELKLEPPDEISPKGPPTETLLVKLRVKPDSDVEALLSYWGIGGRGEAVRPLMEALDDVPGGVSLNISYFFPTFARMRLYTYPKAGKISPAGKEDCFWTAMNFLNEVPDDNMMDREQLLAKLRAEYKEVKGELRFGDVLAVINSQKIVAHMCVHVADDVVFTKNGMSANAPWVLMRRPQMLKEYGGEQALRIRAYRKEHLERNPD